LLKTALQPIARFLRFSFKFIFPEFPMDTTQISSFIDKYCRFKLRSGKEVYGVIWKNAVGNQVTHYFASAVERTRYKKAEALHDEETCEKIKVPVNIDEIVTVEPLPAEPVPQEQ
jgi:hypothetical protein